MNTDSFVALAGSMSLQTLLQPKTGVFTDAVSRFSAIPAVPQAEMPIFGKAAEISAAMERINPAWATAVRQVAPTRLIIVTEYVLSAAPQSALEGTKLMQEIEQAFLSGGDAAAELETVLIALQVLEHLWDPAIADPDEDRTKQIEAYLAGNVAPSQPTPSPAAEKPSPVNTVQSLGDLSQTDLGGVNVFDYTRDMLTEEDTLYDDLLNRYEQFRKDHNKKKTKPLPVDDVIAYLFDHDRYVAVANGIIPGLSAQGGTQAMAAMYERFMRERENRMKTLVDNRTALLPMCPKAADIFNLMRGNVGYQLNPADSQENDVIVVLERIRETKYYKALYPLVQRLKKLGVHVPEANLHAALCYQDLIRQKRKDSQDLNTTYTYGEFDSESTYSQRDRLLARYFLLSHQRGGAAYSDCVYKLFYLYRETLEPFVLADLEETLISMAQTVEDEHAVADFIELVRAFGYVKGAKKHQGNLFAKLLKKNKAPNDETGSKRKISLLVYAAVVALVAVLFPIVLNVASAEQPAYTLGNVLWIVGILLVLTAQIIAMRYAYSKEKWLHLIPLIAMPVALITHYLLGYGFTLPEAWWPGSHNSLFGAPFVIPFLIFMIATFLGHLNFMALRRYVQSALAYHPLMWIALVGAGAATKVISASGYFQIALDSPSFFRSLFPYLLYIVLSLVFSFVLFTSNKARLVFGDNARCITVFSLVFTVIAAIVCTGLVVESGETSTVLSDFPYRLAIMQALFQLPIFALISTTTSAFELENELTDEES